MDSANSFNVIFTPFFGAGGGVGGGGVGGGFFMVLSCVFMPFCWSHISVGTITLQVSLMSTNYKHQGPGISIILLHFVLKTIMYPRIAPLSQVLRPE